MREITHIKNSKTKNYEYEWLRLESNWFLTIYDDDESAALIRLATSVIDLVPVTKECLSSTARSTAVSRVNSVNELGYSTVRVNSAETDLRILKSIIVETAYYG